MKAQKRTTNDPLPRMQPRGPRLMYYRFLAVAGADLVAARAAIVRTKAAVRERGGVVGKGPSESILDPPDEPHRTGLAVIHGTHGPPPRGPSGYIGDLCFDDFGTGLPGVVVFTPMAFGFAASALGNNWN